jgi:hypothetical protein
MSFNIVSIARQDDSSTIGLLSSGGGMKERDEREELTHSLSPRLLLSLALSRSPR